MTSNKKQFDKTSKPEVEPRHRHAAKQQPEHTPDGSFDPQQAAGNLAVQRMLHSSAQAKHPLSQSRDAHKQEAGRTTSQALPTMFLLHHKETVSSPPLTASFNTSVRDIHSMPQTSHLWKQASAVASAMYAFIPILKPPSLHT